MSSQNKICCPYYLYEFYSCCCHVPDVQESAWEFISARLGLDVIVPMLDRFDQRITQNCIKCIRIMLLWKQIVSKDSFNAGDEKELNDIKSLKYLGITAVKKDPNKLTYFFYFEERFILKEKVVNNCMYTDKNWYVSSFVTSNKKFRKINRNYHRAVQY